MNEIKNKIETLHNYLKTNEKEKTPFNELLMQTLEQITDKLEEFQVNMETLEENLSYINEDLSEIQDDLFEEVTLEELEAYEDEYIEVSCSNCDKVTFIEKEALDNNKVIPCPYCSHNLKHL